MIKEKIITSRLIIKSFEEKNRRTLEELLLNDEIKKTYMIPDFNSKEELDKTITKLFDLSYSKDHFVRGIYLLDKLIGFVNDVDMGEDYIELGYVIHPLFHNKGYATEMLKDVIEELLKTYQKVIAAAFSNNLASIKVMQKCGMEKIAREEYILYHGINHHCVYYQTKY